MTREPAPCAKPSREAGVTGALLVLGVLIRFPAFDQPLDRDMAAYALIGDRLSWRTLPYSELFDHKQPLIYPVYAVLQVFGASTGAIRFGTALVAGLCAGLSFWLFAPGLGRLRALGGAAAGLVVGASRVVEGTDLNTEHLLTLCLIVAIGAPVRFPLRDHRRVAWVVGVAFSLALLSKAIAVFALPAAVLSLRLSGRTFREDRTAWLQAICFGSLPMLGVAGVYALRNAVDDLVYGNWTFNQLYAQGRRPTLGGWFEVIESRQPLLWLALGAALLGLWAALRSSRRRGLIVVLGLWMMGTWVGAKYGGADYGHYFAPVVLPACLLAAASFPPLANTGARGSVAFATMVGVVLLLLLAPFAGQVWDNLDETGVAIAQKTYGAQAETWALYEPVGGQVAALARPGDEIYVPRLEPGFIWASGLTPASKHVHGAASNRIPQVGAEVQQELCADPPEWLFVFEGGLPPFLADFDVSQYDVAIEGPNFVVWSRRAMAPAMACAS